MRKFAANYVVSYTGEFLKNGIVIIEDDGTDIRIINTNGDLMESEQLIFYNGILLTGYT